MTVLSLQYKSQVQEFVETFLGPGHFLLQVLLVALKLRNSEGVAAAEFCRGGAGQEGAVEIFNLVVVTDTAHVYLLEKNRFRF